MREYRFDPDGELPVVRALLRGPKGQKQVTLVFDSGCALTQVHHQILSLIGCGEEEKSKSISMVGVTGPGDPAFVVPLTEFRVLGTRFEETEIAGVDFSKWARSGIEGLLGWDLIKHFHFDMDGPKGLLKVF
jgi:hypothetical protein